MESNVEETTPAPAEETAPVRRRASRRATAAAGTRSETAPEPAAAEAAAPAGDAAAPSAAAPAAEAATADAAAAEAAAEAPKKRATRSRKKAADEAPAEEAAAATEAAEAPAEAPKKRATRSRKKAVEEAPAEGADASSAAAAEGDTAESSAAPDAAPAKRTRSRRAQSAEAAPQGDAESVTEQSADATEPVAEPAKSKSRGRAKQAQGDASRADGQTEAGTPEAEKAEGDAASQGDVAKNEPGQGDAPKDDAPKNDAENEGEKNGRGRGRRGRGQKTENGESSEQSEQGDDAKNRGQNQGGEKNGKGDKGDKGENSRSTRTRQRDRKRRGQNDDLEPEITEDDVLLPVAGILDVLDNYAFVRTSGYLPGTSDVYVSLGQVKKYGLRRGDAVVGAIRQPREGESGGRQKYNAIVKVDAVNGRSVDENEKRVDIADLTPVFPQERLRLETESDRLLGRAIDVVAPVGLGQRGLIVLPASAHSTAVVSELAAAVTANRPDAHLMVVLANAQPEEVTHLQRTVSGEVVAATFDRAAEDQATVAELAIDRAKRLVELGHDVVVLLDSLNRFVRAYAQAQHGSSRPALDEIDEFALAQIKRLLAAARNVENGGSLTVLATVQTKTGVDADKLLLREARAVANSEIRLAKGAPGAIPAVDLEASFTRNADAMLGADEAAVLAELRARIASDDDAAEQIAERLGATASNAALLAEIQRGRA